MECELLNTCAFFAKYNDKKDTACRGFIALYCKGEKMAQCKRLEFRKKHGVAPSEDMMPNGLPICND